MADRLTKLQELTAELHAVNKAFSDAARPLEWLGEMNEEQRQKLAKELRAEMAHWESVTQRIDEALRDES